MFRRAPGGFLEGSWKVVSRVQYAYLSQKRRRLDTLEGYTKTNGYARTRAYAHMSGIYRQTLQGIQERRFFLIPKPRNLLEGASSHPPGTLQGARKTGFFA